MTLCDYHQSPPGPFQRLMRRSGALENSVGSLRSRWMNVHAGWLVYLILFACVTCMWWPTLFAGKVIISGDSIIHGLPLLHFFRDFLHGGESPLWVKEIFGGHPLFAEGQGGFASPLNLLVAWAFPPTLGSSVFHYLCMLIAGFGVIKLCQSLGSTVWAAGFAAIAVIFSSSWLSIQNNLTISGALMWVPWALLAFELWLKKPSILRAIFMAVMGSLLIVAGYPQVIHGVVIFALCSLVAMPFSSHGRLQWRQFWRAYIATAGLAALLCLGLSALQLLPLMELVGLSHRENGVDLIFRHTVDYCLRCILFPLDTQKQTPGIANLLVCVLVSLFLAVRSPWRLKGYAVATVLLVVLGIGNALSVFRWLYEAHLVPGLHYFRITWVYLAISAVSMSVLAAFAIDGSIHWLLKHPYRRQWRVRTWLAAVVFFAVWFAIVFRADQGHAWKALSVVAIALLLVVTLFVTRRVRWIAPAMFFLSVTQCVFFSMDQLKFYDAALLQSSSVLDELPRDGVKSGKFFTVSINLIYAFLDSHAPNLDKMTQQVVNSNLGMTNLLRGDSSMDGTLALQLYNRDIINQTLTDEVNGVSQAGPGARMIDLLNVRYITADGELHAPGLRVAGHDRLGFWVMENTFARPFVQVYAHAVGASSADDSLARLHVMQLPTLVVQNDPGGTPVPKDDIAAGNVADVHMSMIGSRSNHYEMDVQAPFACWIFLADANYPGWYGKVDGMPVKVWTAQVLGKAVHIPAGRHRLIVGFRSKSFRRGLKISAFTLLLLLALLVAEGVSRWRRHQTVRRRQQSNVSH